MPFQLRLGHNVVEVQSESPAGRKEHAAPAMDTPRSRIIGKRRVSTSICPLISNIFNEEAAKPMPKTLIARRCK